MTGVAISVAAQSGDGARHGRWTGLFKLGEEAGELTAAAAALQEVQSAGPAPIGDLLIALEDELADVAAALGHALRANGFDLHRVSARASRRIDHRAEVDAAGAAGGGAVRGLLPLIGDCGRLQQVLGKIAAFPDGAEHPDGAGNLPGRLACAIADLQASVFVVMLRNGLDVERIDARRDEKLALFQCWFPVGTPA